MWKKIKWIDKSYQTPDSTAKFEELIAHHVLVLLLCLVNFEVSLDQTVVNRFAL